VNSAHAACIQQRKVRREVSNETDESRPAFLPGLTSELEKMAGVFAFPLKSALPMIKFIRSISKRNAKETFTP
jgi:hypothetical protein